MSPSIHIGVAGLVVAAVAWRPRSGLVAGACAAAAVTEVASGVAPARALSAAVHEALPLTAFLTAAIWMASNVFGQSEHESRNGPGLTGLADRIDTLNGTLHVTFPLTER